MDISTFRWILIIAGIVIVTGIFMFGNPDRKRKPRASRKRIHAPPQRSEPTLDASHGDEQDGGNHGDTEVRQTELAIGGDSKTDQRIEPSLDGSTRAPAQPPPEKIVTLFLQARDNNVITGVEFLNAALKSGLVFGPHNIFHRIDENVSQGEHRPVFSMANLTKPGTFDKTAWNTVEIKGMTLFMALPGPRTALDAWDSMLVTSRRLAALLHTDIQDDSHSTLTRQRSLQIKEELREYDRQQTAST